MRTHFDYDVQARTQLLADLKDKTAELERQLSDARQSLEHELADSARRAQAGARVHTPESRESRTELLLNRGRPSAYRRRFTLRHAKATGIAILVVVIAVGIAIVAGGGASWPASVLKVQTEVVTACQNPDVRSEPGQVNFACASATRQILWVFALLTSVNDPGYVNAKTGRQGLEPITPSQGGQVAWSLNLHHPYNPLNPVDSIQVAARAINNIVGGATLTRSNGSPEVQPGLESDPANCLRYTGSAAVTSRAGFPPLCARPVTTAAGQAALVADVYQKWVVGAAPQAAQDAAVLFRNAKNPGDSQVQAILKHLRGQGLTT